MERVLRLMTDYVHRGKIAVEGVTPLRAEHEATPQFELGYVMSELLDRYRKMVEIARHPLNYKSDTVIDTLRTTELVQRLFFEIYHLVNIIHEIPKKYGRTSEFTNRGYDPSQIADTEKRIALLEKERRRRKKQWLKELMTMQALGELAQVSQRKPVKPGNKWWPIDYGWEIDYYW